MIFDNLLELAVWAVHSAILFYVISRCDFLSQEKDLPHITPTIQPERKIILYN